MDISIYYNYVMLFKDRATRLLVTAAYKIIKAKYVRNIFKKNWVSHYGVSQLVLSDNGKK